MNAPPSRLAAECSGESAVQIGALVPLTRPGWVEAGRHLLTGLKLAAGEGTRGQIRFSRTPGISVWQWAWAPAQVVDRDPAEPGRFRVLRAA